MKLFPIFIILCMLPGMLTCSESDYNNDFSATIEPYTAGETLYQTDFESFTANQEFGMQDWINAGFNLSWVQGFNQGRAHIDSSVSGSGNNSLRIEYPANSFGPSDNGAQAPLTFTPRQEMYVSYMLRFSENFEWGGSNEGGKLPGLSGGDNCSGGETCDGNNGFSARLMWRPAGKAVLYLYHMDKPGTYGEDINLETSDGIVYFQRGIWYTITERVRINSPDKADGFVQIWVNGKGALNVQGIRFVTNSDLVDNFYFSTFHGGNSIDWAPPVDCSVNFDHIRLFTR
jgi:hypothetical protein